MVGLPGQGAHPPGRRVEDVPAPRFLIGRATAGFGARLEEKDPPPGREPRAQENGQQGPGEAPADDGNIDRLIHGRSLAEPVGGRQTTHSPLRAWKGYIFCERAEVGMNILHRCHGT